MVGGGTGLAVARAGLDDQGGSAAAKALLARLDPLASFRITMAMLWPGLCPSTLGLPTHSWVLGQLLAPAGSPHQLLNVHVHLLVLALWLLLAICSPHAWYSQHRRKVVQGVLLARSAAAALGLLMHLGSMHPDSPVQAGAAAWQLVMLLLAMAVLLLGKCLSGAPDLLSLVDACLSLWLHSRHLLACSGKAADLLQKAWEECEQRWQPAASRLLPLLLPAHIYSRAPHAQAPLNHQTPAAPLPSPGLAFRGHKGGARGGRPLRGGRSSGCTSTGSGGSGGGGGKAPQQHLQAQPSGSGVSGSPGDEGSRDPPGPPQEPGTGQEAAAASGLEQLVDCWVALLPTSPLSHVTAYPGDPQPTLLLEAHLRLICCCSCSQHSPGRITRCPVRRLWAAGSGQASSPTATAAAARLVLLGASRASGQGLAVPDASALLARAQASGGMATTENAGHILLDVVTPLPPEPPFPVPGQCPVVISRPLTARAALPIVHPLMLQARNTGQWLCGLSCYLMHGGAQPTHPPGLAAHCSLLLSMGSLATPAISQELQALWQAMLQAWVPEGAPSAADVALAQAHAWAQDMQPLLSDTLQLLLCTCPPDFNLPATGPQPVARAPGQQPEAERMDLRHVWHKAGAQLLVRFASQGLQATGRELLESLILGNASQQLLLQYVQQAGLGAEGEAEQDLAEQAPVDVSHAAAATEPAGPASPAHLQPQPAAPDPGRSVFLEKMMTWQRRAGHTAAAAAQLLMAGLLLLGRLLLTALLGFERMPPPLPAVQGGVSARGETPSPSASPALSPQEPPRQGPGSRRRRQTRRQQQQQQQQGRGWAGGGQQGAQQPGQQGVGSELEYVRWKHDWLHQHVDLWLAFPIRVLVPTGLTFLARAHGASQAFLAFLWVQQVTLLVPHLVIPWLPGRFRPCCRVTVFSITLLLLAGAQGLLESVGIVEPRQDAATKWRADVVGFGVVLPTCAQLRCLWHESLVRALTTALCVHPELALGRLPDPHALRHIATIVALEQGVALWWEVCWRGAFLVRLAGGPATVWQGLRDILKALV